MPTSNKPSARKSTTRGANEQTAGRTNRERGQRVWIISSKRWGNSNERVWECEYWGLAKRVDADTDEFDPDSAPNYADHFANREAAIAHGEVKADPKTNYWGIARVCQMRLEHVADNNWDWEPVGEVIEVEHVEKAQGVA